MKTKQLDNIYYFPLWRLEKSLELNFWTLTSRYFYFLDNPGSEGIVWLHNCPIAGRLQMDFPERICPVCGANDKNEINDIDTLRLLIAEEMDNARA